MKKLLTGIVAAIMVLSFCVCVGCSGKAEVKGETYSTEVISAFCPEGWLAATKYDMLTSKKTEDGIALYKGAENESEAALCPVVQFTYFPENKAAANIDNTRSAYAETEDAPELKFDNYTLTGFISTGGSSKTAILWSEDAGIQVTVEMNRGSGEITLEDADVQAILGSFEAK